MSVLRIVIDSFSESEQLVAQCKGERTFDKGQGSIGFTAYNHHWARGGWRSRTVDCRGGLWVAICL